MRKISVVIILSFLLISVSFSQELLTLESAINIALRNNRDVKIAENNLDIALNNRSLGNAGFLPAVNLTSNYSKSSNNTRQEYFDGRSISRNGAKSNTLNLGVMLEWRIFDGFGNYTRYRRLSEISELVQTQTTAVTEQIISNVISAYYNILQQKEILRALKEGIVISEERIKIAEEKYKVGVASKVELLQARADLNADQNALLRQEISLKNAKINLNLLLGRDPGIDFDVVDTIKISKLSLDDLLSKAFKQNRLLIAAERNVEISKLNLASVRSGFFPNVNFFIGYNFTRSQSQAGFIASNQNLGLNYGLSLSFNLFNGFNSAREYENAQVEVANSQTRYEQLKDEIKSQILNLYENYKVSLKLIELERENLEIAKENVDIALERYRLGVLTPLELREAQKTYIDAEVRLIRAQYQAKLAEVELLRLSGQLLQDR
jgi:outer membrane protein TolC